MFSVGEDVEADALFKRGWTVSAIARHLGRDRKTIRSYLSGERAPAGVVSSGRCVRVTIDLNPGVPRDFVAAQPRHKPVRPAMGY